jgi:2-keto-4-pentenoate hydratase/2-oxohepta-3-ene-1,7-dioic acid hydratase in catechol pathway
MKLLRYSSATGPRLGALKDDEVVALDGLGFGSMLEIIESGEAALTKIKDLLAGETTSLALSEVALLPPLEKPGKYLAIGMNFQKHVAEATKLGVEQPKQQFWFNKQTTCISGPFDDIAMGASGKVDYEVEIGVVIGRKAKSVTADVALDHVFGYLVANDVSARDWQFHSPTFTMGKSFDTHGPIGPWIVTRDEIPDPQTLSLRCWVNGELRQSSDSSQMIHSIARQIEYLSTAFTLEPGDLIASGTPEGVGIGMDPPRFLKAGDVVRCEVEGIGVIENKVAG